MTYLWIALGSALGGMARYWCYETAAGMIASSIPWGTILINILGSFIIGFFAAMTGPEGRWVVSSDLRLFVMVGICGGYTTFSAFSLQTLNLARDGQFLDAGMNILLSVILCLFAVWLGYLAATTFNK